MAWSGIRPGWVTASAHVQLPFENDARKPAGPNDRPQLQHLLIGGVLIQLGEGHKPGTVAGPEAAPASATYSRDTGQPTGLARGAGGSPRGRTPSADMRRAEIRPATAATYATNRDSTTPRDAKGQTHGPGGGGVSARVPLGVVATSGSSRSLPIRGRSGRSWHISANRLNHRPSRRPVARRPTGENSCRSTFNRAIFQATDRRAARDRHPQPLTGSHATVRTARHLHDRAASSPISSGGCSS